MPIRDSGYKQATSGNVAVDFVFGNLPGQTNDDRSGTATNYKTPAAYGATGGGSGDIGWGTTTDFAAAPITTSDFSTTANALTLTAPAGNHVNIVNGWDNYPLFTAPGKTGTGYNPAQYLYATITAISANGTTITVTAKNNFTAGQSVALSGLYKYSTYTDSNGNVQTGAPTYTLDSKLNPVASEFNLSGLTIATASATGFTITNSTTGTALTNVAGLATVTIAASSSTATVPTLTGFTEVEADRLLNNADFDNGSVTYVTAGATDVDLVATGITAASATGGTVTYTVANNFTAGQVVNIFGLSTAAFNLKGVTIATASATGFTVTNAATGTAVSGAATAPVVLSGATAAISATTTYTYTVANTLVVGQLVSISGFASANYNLVNATVATASSTNFTVTGTGLTNSTAVGTGTVVAQPAIARVPANAKTVKSYTPTGTQTVGTAIGVSVWKKASAASAGTQDGAFTY
jgi:hypothetical protein